MTGDLTLIALGRLKRPGSLILAIIVDLSLAGPAGLWPAAVVRAAPTNPPQALLLILNHGQCLGNRTQHQFLPAVQQ